MHSLFSENRHRSNLRKPLRTSRSSPSALPMKSFWSFMACTSRPQPATTQLVRCCIPPPTASSFQSSCAPAPPTCPNPPCYFYCSSALGCPVRGICQVECLDQVEGFAFFFLFVLHRLLTLVSTLGTSKETAMEKYTELAKSLSAKYK
jgi:hypothetical protein